MDNITGLFPGADIERLKFIAGLKSKGINVTQKDIARNNTNMIIFSMPIGPYGARWMFRVNLADGTILCSGGVTKTFFGHNVWVFKNEYAQAVAIAGILHQALGALDGVTLPPDSLQMEIHRIEITRHHQLPAPHTVLEAISAINLMFKTLFPARRFLNGETHDNPGTVGIGLNKSNRVCRVYDPAEKFSKKPDHAPIESWLPLQEACQNHLRIECMFSKRELQAAGLTSIAGWNDQAKVESLLAKRYKNFGLSVQFNDSNEGFTKDVVEKAHPTFVEYARYWFTAGKKGTEYNSRSGSANRYKQYMAEQGYCVDVPFDRHKYLLHGLHAVLLPKLSAELPPEVRYNNALFGHWWEGKK